MAPTVSAPRLDGPRMAAGFSLPDRLPGTSSSHPGPRPATELPAQGVVWLSQGPLRAPTSTPPPAPVTDDTGPNYSGRGWVAQMVVSSYSPAFPDAPPSREGHSAGVSVFPEVCVDPVEVRSQTSVAVLDDGLSRWFGAGGLAVRPSPSGRTSAPAAVESRRP